MIEISVIFSEVYSCKFLADGQAVFILDFDGEEIPVAHCVKSRSGQWHILSESLPESVRRPFACPDEAFDAYKRYIRETAEDEEFS